MLVDEKQEKLLPTSNVALESKGFEVMPFGDPVKADAPFKLYQDFYLRNLSKNMKNEEEVVQKRKRINPATTTKTRRVLVIDDEKDIADVFKFGLEQKGFEVDTFTDPFQALSNFKADHYDAIISDVSMPDMNGFELCKQLVKIDDEAKIFFVSAFVTFKDVFKIQYPNLIIDEKHFIDKPISIYKLVDIISQEQE